MPCYSDCTRSAKRKIVVVEENRKVAAFDNASLEKLTLTKFDNCVDCDGRRADFILNHPDGRRVVIELKGRDLAESREQLQNTLRYLSDNSLKVADVAALIVCARVPLGVSAVQRLAGEVKRMGFHNLRIKSREWRGTFNAVF
jgi:hypothetical protein